MASLRNAIIEEPTTKRSPAPTSGDASLLGPRRREMRTAETKRLKERDNEKMTSGTVGERDTEALADDEMIVATDANGGEIDKVKANERNPSGVVVAFEGLDGVGKTTIVKIVADTLRQRGRAVYAMREPGETSVGERIRAILKDPALRIDARCEALLFAAARAQLANERISPALARGEIVLLDRFVISSLAYQGIGRELGVEAVRALSVFALNGVKADLTLYLRLSDSAALAQRRHRRRGPLDRFENAEEAFLQRVAQAYEQLAVEEPDVAVISSLGSPQEVADRCLREIDLLLEEKERA
jgi:dTMP kinase